MSQLFFFFLFYFPIISTTGIDTFLEDNTGYKKLLEVYTDKNLQTKAHTPLNLNKLADDLSKAFTERRKLLIGTLEKSKTEMKNLTTKDPPEDEVVWATELEDDGNSTCSMTSLPQFHNRVCTHKSFLHLPVDVYKEEPSIMSAVKMSQYFNAIWQSNLKASPDITWQYFASTSGLVRFYPGSKWPKRDIDSEDEAIDLYDVRRKSWYISGMSLPKLMLILIDSSGSSQGQALALMKHTAKNLIDTLTEDDFFNVLNFPTDDVSHATFPSFTKATYRNKRKALEWAKQIQSFGIANFTTALHMGFKLYENTTMHCNKLIMLLTDGGAEKPIDVLAKHNSLLSIRIFTYLIGPISTDAPDIKWIAEKNRGAFYQIPSIVSIRGKTQDYIRYLSESKRTMSADAVLSWTSANYDHLNNNLVVTCSAPIFKADAGSGSSELAIKGVVAIDLDISQLIHHHAMPSEKEYVFVLNAGGFLMYHPLLLKMNGKFLPIDLVDLENHDKILEVREAMLSGQPGSMEVDDFDESSDDHRMVVRKRKYQYAPIPGTQFSVCVVTIVDDNVKECTFPPGNPHDVSWLFKLEKDGYNWINHRHLCHGDQDEEQMEKDVETYDITHLDLVASSLQNKTCDDESSSERLSSVLFHAEASSLLLDIYEQFDNESGVLFMFFHADNFWRVHPQISKEMFLKLVNFYKSQEDKLRGKLSWTSVFFDGEVDYGNTTTEGALLLVRKLLLGGNKDTQAVVGVLVHSDLMETVVNTDLSAPNNVAKRDVATSLSSPFSSSSFFASSSSSSSSSSSLRSSSSSSSPSSSPSSSSSFSPSSSFPSSTPSEETHNMTLNNTLPTTSLTSLLTSPQATQAFRAPQPLVKLPSTVAWYLVNEEAIILSSGNMNGEEDDEEDEKKALTSRLWGRFLGEARIQRDVMNDLINRGIFTQHNNTNMYSSCDGLEVTDSAHTLTSLLTSLQIMTTLIIQAFMTLLCLFQTILSISQDLVMATVEFYTYTEEMPNEYCVKDLFKYQLTEESRTPHIYHVNCTNCIKTYRTQMYGETDMLLVTVDNLCLCPSSSLPFKPRPNTDWEVQRGGELYQDTHIDCPPFVQDPPEKFGGSAVLSCSLLSLLLPGLLALLQSFTLIG